jgi:hypothetical protein
MKSLFNFLAPLLILLLVVSCNNMSIDQLQNEVLNDIKAKIENQGQDIQVQSFVLTHVSANEYVGVLETLENGQLFTYNVNVISDGKSFVWEIPPSQISNEALDSESNQEEVYSDESYEETDSYEEEDGKNMIEAMENISDPTYCSLCKGTGVQKNTAQSLNEGPDYLLCQMCEGKGRRTY